MLIWSGDVTVDLGYDSLLIVVDESEMSVFGRRVVVQGNEFIQVVTSSLSTLEPRDDLLMGRS